MYYGRIIEIIVHLLREMSSNKNLNEDQVTKLKGMGYTQNEINAAFSWIYDKFGTREKLFQQKSFASKSHRVLHHLEKQLISPEAFGYLIQLKELGLINDDEIEVIIEKILISRISKINLEDMKLFVASILFELDDNFMPRQIMLSSNDTIH